MNLNRRLLVLTLAGTLSLGLLSACGGGNTPAPETTPSAIPSPQATAAPTASPDLPEEGLDYPFSDVDASSWYGPAVYWARANGIVTGTSDTTFTPDRPVTRQEMAAILHRYAEFAGYDVSASADLSGYTDAGDIAGYAQTAMAWANGVGLVTGTSDTTLSPTGSAVRGQVATILMRFLEHVAV